MSDGFDYQEPDGSNSLAAIRASDGTFYFQNDFEDGDESMTIAVAMSPTEAERFARWILSKLAPQGESSNG